MSTNQQKKTNYPHLERLPPTNFWKHLLNWAWNKPRIIIEELYYNHFIRPKVELEQIKLELELKNFQLVFLKGSYHLLLNREAGISKSFFIKKMKKVN